MKLVLYHMQHCPFSAKVRNHIEKNNLKSKVEYRDIDKDSGALDELEELTSDDQVPCLVIDGKPLLESDAIIDFLRENFVQAA